MSTPTRRTARRWLALTAAVAAGTLIAPSPADATNALSADVSGVATGKQQREWFNTAFDTEPRFFGKVRGRIRFVTDTTARLDSTRRLSSDDRGDIDAGEFVNTRLGNDALSSRLRVTARPALQMLVEWQPRNDPYVCNNTTFPTFSGDDWFMRTDGGGAIGDGFCGAIEVTADDLNTIPLDLELPEVFTLLNRQFDPGYTGTRQLEQSSQILEVKVCKIVTKVFDVPIGDHCDIQLNAETSVPLTNVSHTLDAQLCTSAQINGHEFPCIGTLGPVRPVTFNGGLESFSTKAPCLNSATDVDVRLAQAAWNARVDAVTIGLSADFNVHLRADGDGVDLLTLPLPGSISLLTAPIPLRVEYPSRILHVGDLTPDDDPPFAALSPSSVTVDEGSSATLTPIATDRCTTGPNLTSTWAIDGTSLVAPVLTRTYPDDKPAARHDGSLVVRDERGNASPAVPFDITVRNVAPTVSLDAPSEPFPLGTQARFAAGVTDPGADVMRWDWAFGDGTSATRTASGVEDRTDTRTHAFTRPGEYTVQVGVDDGTDRRSASAKIVAFDPADRLVGTGTYTADSSSIGVPTGSSYTIAATVAYAKGAVRPSGTFRSEFSISASPTGGHARRAVFQATAFEWLFETPLTTRVQGFGTVDGEAGWKFLAQTTRTSNDPHTSRVTVTMWRPGVTTAADPDYRFGGPRDTGNIV